MTREHAAPGTTVSTRLGPLHVRTTGAGPTALLWHSLFVDSTTWARVEPGLANHHRLILVDGPCHGPNPRARGPAVPSLRTIASEWQSTCWIISALPSPWTGSATLGADMWASCSPQLTLTGAAAW